MRQFLRAKAEMRANAFKEFMALKRKMEVYSSLAPVRRIIKEVDRAARQLNEEANNAQAI